jgi:hypothetical protein
MSNQRSRISKTLIVLLFFIGDAVIPAHAGAPEALPTVSSVNAPKIAPVRNNAGKAGTSTNNLTYHFGPVMTQPVAVTPIYWGPKWADPVFMGDKNTGLSALYASYNGSSHADISTQYTQSSGAKTSKVVTVNLSIKDTSTASSSTANVLSKVVATVGFLNLSNDGYYPVYTDLPRGNAGYCAWHSAGTVTQGGISKTIKFAFFFDLTGDAGCDPADLRNDYSQATEALANVSIHEIAEAMTDPQLNAWYDKQGYENADKCAWKFSANGVQLVSGGYFWKIQGEWDNATSSCKW